jgi:hypothetical protein
VRMEAWVGWGGAWFRGSIGCLCGAVLILGGCERRALLERDSGDRGGVPGAVERPAGTFVWEGQILRRSGESTEPSPGLPTNDLIARAEARRSAQRALELAIRELPVNDTATVGEALERSASLSLAVQRLVLQAKVAEGSIQRQADGRVSLILEFPTVPLGQALRVHRVTPELGLPPQPVEPSPIRGAPVV